MNDSISKNALVLRHALIGAAGQSARELRSKLNFSQPTFARAAKSLVQELLIMGSARNTTYALKRNISGQGSQIPVYQIDRNGSARALCNLIPVYPRGFYVRSLATSVKSKLYTDLPYWLHDIRPSGFLGRLIPKRFPELTFPADIRLWSNEECLRYWNALGVDLIGDLVVGQYALNIFNGSSTLYDSIQKDERAVRFESLATEILSHGTAGSSAAGEQPKFLTSRTEKGKSLPAQVIVKFSPIGEGAIYTRRRSLLVCNRSIYAVLVFLIPVNFAKQ